MQNLSRLILVVISLLLSCQQNPPGPQAVNETAVKLSSTTLTTYRVLKGSKYLLVFESGLGNGHESWNPTGNNAGILELADQFQSDILLYDRAGYGKSGESSIPRTINQLRSELELVIDQQADGRKIVLIAHSLGGLIARDYAIKNPSKTAGLLFIDPAHELYNQPTQAIEDQLYGTFVSQYGAQSGAATEARELRKDLQYASRLPALPNIPVVVLTSMKHDAVNTMADTTYHKTRQDWYNAHESLRNGVTDFTHVITTTAGHYIHQEDPAFFITNLKLLLKKLP